MAYRYLPAAPRYYRPPPPVPSTVVLAPADTTLEASVQCSAAVTSSNLETFVRLEATPLVFASATQADLQTGVYLGASVSATATITPPALDTAIQLAASVEATSGSFQPDGWWPLISSGVDSSGHNLTLANKNATAINFTTPAKLTGAAQFTGVTTEGLGSSDASLQAGDFDFTIGAWFRFTDLTANRCIMSKQAVNPQRSWNLSYGTGTTTVFFRVSADGTNLTFTDCDSGLIPALNTWYFVVAWHDATNNQLGIQVWTEAALAAAFTRAYSAGMVATTARFAVGANDAADPNWQQPMKGAVGPTFYVKQVLSQSKIRALWNEGVGVNYPFPWTNVAILTTGIALEAAVAASATVTPANLNTGIYLTTTVTASAIPDVALSVGMTLDAQPECSATITLADLGTEIRVGASVACSATVGLADLTAGSGIAASVAVSASATQADLQTRVYLSATEPANATITSASLLTSIRLGASVSATAIVTPPTLLTARWLSVSLAATATPGSAAAQGARALWRFEEADQPTGTKLRLDDLGRSPLTESGPLVGLAGLDGRAGQHGVSGGGQSCSGTVHSDVALFGATAWTIYTTFQFIDIGGADPIRDHAADLLKSTPSGYTQWALRSIQAGVGSWTLRFYTEASGQLDLVQPASALVPGVWYTVVARYASGNLTLKARSDVNPTWASQTSAFTITNVPGASGSAPFAIGPTGTLEMLRDSVGIAHRAIPDSELDQIATFGMRSGPVLATAIYLGASVACAATAQAVFSIVLDASVQARATVTLADLHTEVRFGASVAATASTIHPTRALWRFEEPDQLPDGASYRVRVDDTMRSPLQEGGALIGVAGLDGRAGQHGVTNFVLADTSACSGLVHPDVSFYGALDWTVVCVFNLIDLDPGAPELIRHHSGSLLQFEVDDDVHFASWSISSAWAGANWTLRFDEGYNGQNATVTLPSSALHPGIWYTLAARYIAATQQFTIKIRPQAGSWTSQSVTFTLGAPVGVPVPGNFVIGPWSTQLESLWDTVAVVFRAISDAELDQIATAGAPFGRMRVGLETAIHCNATIDCTATAVGLALGFLALCEASVTCEATVSADLDTAIRFEATEALAVATIGEIGVPETVALWRFEETSGDVRVDALGSSPLTQYGELTSIAGIDGLAGQEGVGKSAGTDAALPAVSLYGATDWTVFGTWTFANVPEGFPFPQPSVPIHSGLLLYSSGAKDNWWLSSDWQQDINGWRLGFTIDSGILQIEGPSVLVGRPEPDAWYTFAARYDAASGMVTLKLRAPITGWISATVAHPPAPGEPDPAGFYVRDIGVGLNWDSIGVVHRALSDAELEQIATTGPGFMLSRGVELTTAIWMQTSVTGVATIDAAHLTRESIPSYVFGTSGFQRIFKTQGPGRFYSRTRGT